MSWIQPEIKFLAVQETDWLSFEIKNVSRHFLWLLQNMVKLKKFRMISHIPIDPTHFFIPEKIEKGHHRIYINAIIKSLESYEFFLNNFRSVIELEYDKRFAHRKESEQRKLNIQEITLSIADYLLPRAIMCDASFEINITDLAILRQSRKCVEFGQEGDDIISAMIQCSIGDKFFQKEDKPYERWLPANKAEFIQMSFDSFLISGKTYSKLLEYIPSKVGMGFILPIIMGSESKHPAAIWNKDLFVDPLAKRRVETAMKQIYYQFANKVSFLADDYFCSDGGIRVFPALYHQISQRQNYFIPWLINKTLIEKYTESLDFVSNSANEILRSSFSGFYLLPNAWKLRVIESINLFDMVRRAQRFLCLNVPYEIWETTRESVAEIISVHPDVKKLFVPPCTIRNDEGIKMPCPYTDNYCGIQTWRNDVCCFDRSTTY